MNRKAITKVILGVIIACSLNASYAAEKKKPKAKTDDKQTVDSADQSVQDEEKAPVLKKVDKMPQFQGGPNGLNQYLQWNLKYPIEAQKKGIEGLVYINFVVEKDGRVNMVKLVRSVDYFLDREALRVVKAMPKWIPGILNGEAVRVSYTMPINFKLR